MRVGQEATHLGDDPVARERSFGGRTRRDVEAELAHVEAGAARYASFAGIALHDHAGWSALRP